jgi:hypothetical protein
VENHTNATLPDTKRPDYYGDGVAVWINHKADREYLTIKITGHNIIYANKTK